MEDTKFEMVTAASFFGDAMRTYGCVCHLYSYGDHLLSQFCYIIIHVNGI